MSHRLVTVHLTAETHGPTPTTSEMAAAARQARSRQVAAQASNVLAVVSQVQAERASSLRAIVTALHEEGGQTPAGKEEWSAAQVRRLLAHAGPGHGLGSPALPPPP